LWLVRTNHADNSRVIHSDMDFSALYVDCSLCHDVIAYDKIKKHWTATKHHLQEPFNPSALKTRRLFDPSPPLDIIASRLNEKFPQSQTEQAADAEPAAPPIGDQVFPNAGMCEVVVFFDRVKASQPIVESIMSTLVWTNEENSKKPGRPIHFIPSIIMHSTSQLKS